MGINYAFAHSTNEFYRNALTLEEVYRRMYFSRSPTSFYIKKSKFDLQLAVF